ncbi:MAG: DUF1570 domain-containing protein [Planctomycetia bacterium]|nr:DUF1570 domain-containing protein [Planctomycetia bacterium]
MPKPTTKQHRRVYLIPRSIRWMGPLMLLAAIVACGFPRFASAQGWRDQRAFGPFVCYADFPLASYDPLISELGEIQAELVQRLQLPPADKHIEVYLFRDRMSYRRYLNQRFPNVPYRQALFVSNAGQESVLTFRSEELPVDLRHESTHAMLHAVLPDVPLWLDEGLAEYFEVPAADRATKNPHHNATKWWMRLGQVPVLTKLEAKRTINEMGSGEYREAWAYVHFLLHGPPAARAELIRYLADIRASNQPGQPNTPPGALSQRLSTAFPDLPGALVEHFKTFGP